MISSSMASSDLPASVARSIAVANSSLAISHFPSLCYCRHSTRYVGNQLELSRKSAQIAKEPAGRSALSAGVRLAPQGIGGALMLPISGRLTARVGGGPVVVPARHRRDGADRRRVDRDHLSADPGPS